MFKSLGPSPAQQFQSKLKDFIKLSSKTEGGNGAKLVELKRELQNLATKLSPSEIGILQQEAGKQAMNEMKQENSKFKPKKGGPQTKYQLPQPCVG